MELLLIVIAGSFATLSLCVVYLLGRAHRYLSPISEQSATDVPSVSVCIPARNEAHALSACLDRVLASDYEKLEILVLDDESIDQTPTLIKSFAHAGVRFIAGKPLPDGWIGKNHALDTLAREASGDIILFLDVDVRVSSRAISQLVRSMTEGMHIVSVIPQRGDTYRASAIFGHMRYFWDMVHVGMGSQSATASIWCVRRDWLLETARGLESVREVIRPELSLISNGQARSACLLGQHMGVGYEKHWHSQVESSERLIIPTIRQYGYRGALSVLWLLLGVITIISSLVFILTAPSLVAMQLLGVVFVSGYVVHFAYLRMAWRSRAWLGAMFWWWVAAQELLLTAISGIRYVTKTVSWKGRSIHAQPENNDYYSV